MSYLIDWGEDDIENKQRYFDCLGDFLIQLKILLNDDVDKIIKEFDAKIVNVNEGSIKRRFNIDFPEEVK